MNCPNNVGEYYQGLFRWFQDSTIILERLKQSNAKIGFEQKNNKIVVVYSLPHIQPINVKNHAHQSTFFEQKTKQSPLEIAEQLTNEIDGLKLTSNIGTSTVILTFILGE
jgi:hypothetical protein